MTGFKTPWIGPNPQNEIRPPNKHGKIEEQEPPETGSSQLLKVRFLAEKENLPLRFEIIGCVKTFRGNIRQNEEAEYSVIAELSDLSGVIEVRYSFIFGQL
jgi:hypothetical protein